MKQEKLTTTKGSKVTASAKVEKIDFAKASMDTLKADAMERAALYASRSKKAELTPNDAMERALVKACVNGVKKQLTINAIYANLLSIIRGVEPACYHLAIRQKAKSRMYFNSSLPAWIHTVVMRDGKAVDMYYPVIWRMVDSIEDATERYNLISLDEKLDEKLVGYSFSFSGCGAIERIDTSDVKDLLHKSKHEEVVSVVKGAQRITELDDKGRAKKHLVERMFYPQLIKDGTKGNYTARYGADIYNAFAHAIAMLVWDNNGTSEKSSKKNSKK